MKLGKACPFCGSFKLSLPYKDAAYAAARTTWRIAQSEKLLELLREAR